MNAKKTQPKMTEWEGFYSTSQVSRLARVPRSTLYSWKENEVVTPSLAIVEDGEVIDYGYSYADLTIIRLIRAIRDKKLNLKSISIALRHLIERFGLPNKGWANVHVYIANNKVYADKPDEWEITAATQHGQKIEPRLFDDVFDILRNMEEDGDILVPKGYAQCVEINPDVMDGEPVVRNTRLPTSVLAMKFRKGKTIDELADLYKPISRQCIEQAIEYEEFLNTPISKTREVVAGR